MSSVARTVATAERMKVRVDWLDVVIGNICLHRDRLVFSEREGGSELTLRNCWKRRRGFSKCWGRSRTKCLQGVFLLF